MQRWWVFHRFFISKVSGSSRFLKIKWVILSYSSLRVRLCQQLARSLTVEGYLRLQRPFLSYSISYVFSECLYKLRIVLVGEVEELIHAQLCFLATVFIAEHQVDPFMQILGSIVAFQCFTVSFYKFVGVRTALWKFNIVHPMVVLLHTEIPLFTVKQELREVIELGNHLSNIRHFPHCVVKAVCE